MRWKVFVLVLVAMGIACVACGVHGQDVKNTEQSEDRVIRQSLEVSPGIKAAQLTCKVKTKKKQQEVEDSYSNYIPKGIFSLYELADITQENDGYTLVYDGIYNEAYVNIDKKDTVVVEEKHFNATDGKELEFPIKVSELGVCIEPKEEWQNDNRRVYVIADLKDGTSRLITKLPAVDPASKKKYQIDPPEEVQKITEQEDDVSPNFITWGCANDLPNCGVRIATRIKIDVGQIEKIRLIVQKIE